MERPHLRRRDEPDDSDEPYADMTEEEIRQFKLYQQMVSRKVFYRLFYRDVARLLEEASDFITFSGVYNIPEEQLLELMKEYESYRQEIYFRYFGADGVITAIGRSKQATEVIYWNTMTRDDEFNPTAIETPESFHRLTAIIDSVLKEYEFTP